MKIFLLVSITFSIGFIHCQSSVNNSNQGNGQLIRYESFPSSYVNPKGIDIWLPSDYSETKKYAVIYMHDSQMLFDSTKTWNHKEWKVDETMSRLMKEEKIKDAIVVGIENDGSHRAGEYFPEAVLPKVPEEIRKDLNENFLGGNATADEYLKFLVHELKPYIDSKYSTLSDQSNTFIMGSSMGGLISLYAICEYPDVFGGAGCISTHWPLAVPQESSGYNIAILFREYVDEHLPSPSNHKIYFDYGTVTLDSLYPPHQHAIDSIMIKHGYTSANWITKEFPGDEHSEVAWSRRFHIPVEFLLKDSN